MRKECCGMKVLGRAAAAAAAALLLVSGCGAPGEAVPEQAGQELSAQETVQVLTEVHLPYSEKDSLNPYTCTTMQNHYLCQLLFDTLVRIDSLGTARNSLAQEVVQKQERWVVKLRADACFSDGTRVTAEDIRYSCTLAQGSAFYAPQLAQLAEVQTPDEQTVVFLLREPDVFFDRSLCFPVVKGGTGEQSLPGGGGRYRLSSDPAELVQNPFYHTGGGGITRIFLHEAESSEDQSYGMMENTIDFMYFDPSEELNLGLGSAYRQVQLSNLVFLGVNSQGWGFQAPLRTVLSGLINRENIARKAYLGFAAASGGLIRPSFGDSTASSALSGVSREKVEARLDAMGYGQRDSEGWRIIAGRRFTLRLLVNSENSARVSAAEQVAADIEAAGIQVMLEKVGFETYRERIAAGEYDLYIGETQVSANLDLSALLSPNAVFGPGCAQDAQLLEAYRQMKAGEISLDDFDAAFQASMPVIPLLYRRGAVCFSRDFSANILATERDIFYNIEEW